MNENSCTAIRMKCKSYLQQWQLIPFYYSNHNWWNFVLSMTTSNVLYHIWWSCRCIDLKVFISVKKEMIIRKNSGAVSPVRKADSKSWQDLVKVVKTCPNLSKLVKSYNYEVIIIFLFIGTSIFSWIISDLIRISSSK